MMATRLAELSRTRLACSCLIQIAGPTFIVHGIYWLFRSEKFTVWWFGQFALIAAGITAVAFVLKDGDPILELSDRAVTGSKWISRLERRTLQLLYFSTSPLFSMLGATFLAFGAYWSEVNAAGDARVRYLVSLLAICLWIASNQIERVVNRFRLAIEARFTGEVMSAHHFDAGRRLAKVMFFGRVVGALGLVAVGGFVIYAFLFTDSNRLRLLAAVAVVSVEGISCAITLLFELALCLTAPRVLYPSQVTWGRPTGLLLRSFDTEKPAVGSFSIAQMIQFFVELSLRNGRVIDGSGQPIRYWLGVARPGQYFVTPGVQRVALDNDSWQEWVVDAMDRADVIVVLPGRTNGIDWEMRQITGNRLTKLRVLIGTGHSHAKFFVYLLEVHGLGVPTLPPLIGSPRVVQWIDRTPTVMCVA